MSELDDVKRVDYCIVNPQYEDIFCQFPGQVTLELVPWELESQPGGAAAVLLLLLC